jgi:acetyl coenzyme A synthetase (ADP forming)-like protein
MDRSLDAILRPSSIAVIGASHQRGTIGAELFHNLLTHGFTGAVYPVHRTAKVVQSVKAYPSILDIPDPIELAIVAVPRDAVLPVVEECGQKGVCGVVVITAGFREVDAEGARLEARLLERVRHYGMRMVGPNCLGVQNIAPDISLDATFAPTFPPFGRVSFSSQSGALGVAILDYARALGIGISSFVSVGNKADVSGNDLIEYWEHDPNTDVILLYLESFGNPTRFSQLARRVSRRKPIVAVKSGRTQSGARAASSHTGSIAGLDVAVDALLKQAGVIRTETIEELFDMAMLLANQPLPRGNRVAILTNAGGPGIMAADACDSHGLKIPALSARTMDGLRAFLPSAASVKNPVDMIASATAPGFERGLKLLMEDPEIDAVIAIYVPPIGGDAAGVARAIVAGAEGGGKPVLSCFMGTHGVTEALSSLKSGHIPSYAFPEAAAIALARAVEYARWRDRPEGNLPELEGLEPARVRAVLSHRPATVSDARWLTPAEVGEVLSAYGIPMVQTRTARSAGEAAAVAAEIGFPVVLKLDSPTITHKSEVGGVVLDLKSRREVEWAYRDLERRIEALGRRDELAGVVLQPQRSEGIETIVGVTQDPTFGRLMMFGLGGILVELMRDVSFRIHPITDLDAREMVRAIKGYPLFEGFRGGPPGDVAALEQVLLRVSRLVSDFPELLEMDLNPLKVLPPGEGCVALDARIRVRVATG